jgi:hypothetical protein
MGIQDSADVAVSARVDATVDGHRNLCFEVHEYQIAARLVGSGATQESGRRFLSRDE